MKNAGPGLDDAVRRALRAELPGVVAEVVAAVAEQVPAYRRPLEGRFGDGVRRGVEVALGRFVDPPDGSGATLPPQDREVYVELGRGELLQGRSLEALLAAYRVGARAAFRRFAALGVEHGMTAEAVVPLAESTFAYIDELSAASIEGFAAEQSRQAGRRDRQRQELLDRLLDGTLDPTTAAETAAAAGWDLPDDVVVVAVEPAEAEGLSTRLGPDALVGERAGTVVAVLPVRVGGGPLAGRLGDRRAAISPSRPRAQAAGALRLAVLGLRLPDGQGPVVVEQELAALVLHRDPELRDALVRHRLAPLDHARAGSRDRLAETLLAWLAHRGARQAVADLLNVHTQTVAYRIGVLRRLFGAELDDPDARFELELALRASGVRLPAAGT